MSAPERIDEFDRLLANENSLEKYVSLGLALEELLEKLRAKGFETEKETLSRLLELSPARAQLLELAAERLLDSQKRRDEQAFLRDPHSRRLWPEERSLGESRVQCKVLKDCALVTASWILLKSSARSRLLTTFTLGALSLGLCTPALGQAIVVGAKEFTEQLLVAEMSVQLLRAHGFNAHKGTGFAATGVRTLQESGIVDLYWEYTGTSLTTFNHITEKLSPDEGYERVKALDAQRGLVWLSPSKVNNTYALAMRRADAAARRIRSISDLAAKVREGEGIKLASTLEFLSRTDGLQPLQQTYGFKFTLGNVIGMDTGAIYNALRRGFDVGVVFATDGRISAFDLTVLRDDQGFFPSYLLTPVIREATLNRYPALKPVLEALSAQLDNETMVALNSAVDLEGRKLEDVASEFVRSRGLVEKP